MSKRGFPDCVLVLEDDAVLALMIEETLLEAGSSKIFCYSTTEQAVEFLRTQRPDLVVVDIHVADADDGYVIAEIVSLLGPKPPQIVFSTGTPGDIPGDIAKLGVVLEKPYAPEDLIRAATQKPSSLLRRLLPG